MIEIPKSLLISLVWYCFVVVALALDEQMQEEAIPCTGNDVVMDVVIHPSMKA